ncbi:MAG: PaaI family thioesterase [Thaumarchaeota archaeon]|nr:PaaI family thioesterase [Nitrososphaerota archaeon]
MNKENSASFDEKVGKAGGFKKLFQRWKEMGLSPELEIESAFSKESGIFKEMGFKIDRVGDGLAELSFKFSDAVSGRRGHPHVHGGVIMTALDTAMGLAAMTVNTGTDQSTLELKANFLSPMIREPFIVRGRVIRNGRSTAVVEGEAIDSEGTVCAKALGTWFKF